MATKAKKAVYDEDSIQVLGFPDAVRKKTSFYIGPTDASGVWTIVREAADNAVDEALAERNNFVHIHFDKTPKGIPQYWVRDNGAGIPVRPKKFDDVTVPAIEAILTRMHSSGKFDDKAYSVARGTHGLGLKATNALSVEFEVFTCREGQWYNIAFSKGVKTQPLKKCKAPKSPSSGKPLNQGTLVRVVPDKTIFSENAFPASMAFEWAKVSAYFTPKFKVLLTSANGKSHEVYYPEGPKAFTKERVDKLKCTPLSPDVFVSSTALFDCVAQFTDYDGTEFLAFTNGLKNAEGGVHYNAFFAALKKAIDPHMKAKQEFTIQELREGVIGLMNAKLSAPNFDSQTKEKLVDPRADKPLHDLLLADFKKFFAGNKALAAKICARCFELKNLKNKFIASKNVLKEIKRVTSLGFPSKASTSPHAKPDQRELFLIEGESAGGTARSARDASYQELLPLKGKILNALKHKDDKVLLSEEVLNILAMIGFDPNASNPLDKIRVGKIISLADPDPDGPLHGDTLVNVMVKQDGDELWSKVSMRDLSTDEWMGREYYVNAYNGHSFVTARAHSSRITEHSERQIAITLENGEKIICAPKHQFALGTTKYDPRIVGNLRNGMSLIRADRLKTGDRLCQPLKWKGLSAHESRMTTLQIVKLKESKCELTPWYCLTVPNYENFVLSSGAVSKNCHINSLIMALLFKWLPGLFKSGKVYAAKTPEFYSLAGGKLIGGATPDDVERKLQKAKLKGTVRHIKGYGEVDPDILRIMAFDPNTRHIVRITSVDSDGALKFKAIMGEGTEGRKLLLGI